jgi:hypothetical protein
MKDLVNNLRINFMLTNDEIMTELKCSWDEIENNTRDLPQVHVYFDQHEFYRKYKAYQFKPLDLANKYRCSVEELRESLPQKMRTPNRFFIRLLEDLQVEYHRELVSDSRIEKHGNEREAKICMKQCKNAHRVIMSILEEKHPVLKSRIEQQLEILEKNAIRYGIEIEKLGKAENILTSLND